MIDLDLSALTSGDDAWAEKVVEEIRRLPTEHQVEVLDILRGMLEAKEADQRWWAVRAISEIPRKEAALLLSGMLNDQAPDVCQCAALGLRSNPTQEALPKLIELLDSPDLLSSRLAGDSLAALGNLAVPALLEQLDHGSSRQKLNAIRTLAAIGDPQAIPAFFAALDDPSMLIEHWANEGLERMGIGMTYFHP